MGEHNVNINIIKVTDPWNFLATENLNDCKSADRQEFLDMWRAMNKDCSEMAEGTLPPYRPEVNEMCAALRRTDYKWHRVLVKSVNQTSSGLRATCTMVDEGSEIVVPAVRLQKLKNKYKTSSYPSQVHQCCLWGVQPLSLQLEESDEGLESRKRPCKRWDRSVVSYMENMIKESEGCQAEIVKKGSGGKWYLRLYFIKGTKVSCFNELLIDQDYAVAVSNNNMFEEEFETSDGSSSSTKNLRKGQLLDKMSDVRILSGSEDSGRSHKTSLKKFMQESAAKKMEDPAVLFVSGGCGRGALLQTLKKSLKQNVPGTSSSPLQLTGTVSSLFDRMSQRKVLSIDPDSSAETSILSPHTISCSKSACSPSTCNCGGAKAKQSRTDSRQGSLSSSSQHSIISSLDESAGPTTPEKLRNKDRDISFKPSSSMTYSEERSRSSSSSPGKRSRYKGLQDKEAAQTGRQIQQSRDSYMKQREGQKFLDQLRQSSGKTQTVDADLHPQTVRQGKPVPQPLFGTMVHGNYIPHPKYDVEDVPFTDDVKKTMIESLNVTVGQGIQPYSWVASMRWRHIVGISPAGHGKTMAYVPALISNLSDRNRYLVLPRGKGPYAIVLVPSWKKANKVYDMIQSLTGSGVFVSKRIRTIALYAGGTEDNEEIQCALIKGCEILVSTPNSLLRMLREDYTSFKRLCHVILDDADVLAKEFSDEVESIMQRYAPIMQDLKDLSVPKQIMIFSTHWTEDIQRFSERYTREPVIIISSRVEASVYGGVKQVIHMSRQTGILSILCRICDSLASTNQKLIAFTSKVKEAEDMTEAIKSRGIYCLLIHHEMDDDSVEETRKQWLQASSKQLIAMVCTDSCYQDLAVTDATAVIHYGLPNSKTKFGNRMACMFSNFIDRTDRFSSQKEKVEPVSYVILTDQCAERAESLLEIVKRGKSEYSPDFLKFVEGYQAGLEKRIGRNLCPVLKAFGFCLNKGKCSHRHILVPELDLKTSEVSKDTLPPAGEVKLSVIHVINSSRFYCHLFEHRLVGEVKCRNMRFEYQDLVMRLAAYFCRESNQIPYHPSDNLAQNGLCAFKDETGSFSRAKVMELKEGTKSKPMKQCKVWLVDAGCYKFGTIDQLLMLPPELAEIPYQAFEVYVCRIKPMDNDAEWTDKSDMFVEELIKGKVLVGRIVLRLGTTMWLDPLVHQVKLKEVGFVNDIVIRQELLANKFATTNPTHIQNLYDLCRGKTEIPETIMRQYFDYCLEIELTQETLDSNEDFHAVCMAAVTNPGHFYIQKWESFHDLEDLEDQIDEAMNNINSSEGVGKADTGLELECGSVCVAKSLDERWSRAKIVAPYEEGKWKVFFLDYGNCEWVLADNIRPLPRRFSELPCQAIECELAHIECIGEQWDTSSVDCLCDLTYFVDQQKKKLFAKVFGRKDPCYTMGLKVVVDIFDTTIEDIRIAEELVRHHIAKCSSEEAGIKNVLEKPALKNQLFFNPLDKIPFLCANIYWAEVNSDAVAQAKELADLLLQRKDGGYCSSWDLGLEQRGVLPAVVSVIGYIPCEPAHEIILNALVQCCEDSPRICELIIQEKLAYRLTSCFEQSGKPEIQLQAAKGTERLVHIKRFRDASAGAKNLVSTLSEFLQFHLSSPLPHELLQYLCSCAAECVLNTEDSFDRLRDKGMVDFIVSSLKICDSDVARKPFLKLLAAVATWKGTHAHIIRESTLPILLNILENSQCNEGTSHLLCVFQSLINRSHKHKRVLLENKLLIILQSLLQKGVRSPSLELCEKLQSDMQLNLPDHEVLAGTHVNLSDMEILVPEVRWRQIHSMVFVTVKVPSAKESDFSLSENRLCCRVIADGVIYELNWELFDNIIPDDSRICAQSNVTTLDLRKDAKGFWGRLLKSKVKPSNLHTDYSSHPDLEEENKMKYSANFNGTIPRRPASSDESEDSSDFLHNLSGNDDPVFDIDRIMLGSHFN